MSLDVYLYQKGASGPKGSGIFVRENGATQAITREEWDRAFPGREPVVMASESDDSEPVYQRNITHNLGKMAREAGIYEHLWRPEEIGIKTADQLIEPLWGGLMRLENDPGHFEQFNPSNGWGNYEGLMDFVREYLKACREYPQAEISVSR